MKANNTQQCLCDVIQSQQFPTISLASKRGVTSTDATKTTERMKSIKEKAEEYENNIGSQDYCWLDVRESFEAGANYVLDAITECMPKTHSFNPNEVIDIIASRIKQLKK